MRKMGCLFLFPAFVIFTVLVTAGIQNIAPLIDTEVTFELNLTKWIGAWDTGPIPLALVLPASFLVGVLAMGIFDLGTIFGLRRENKRLTKELKGLRAEIGYPQLPAVQSDGVQDESEPEDETDRREFS